MISDAFCHRQKQKMCTDSSAKNGDNEPHSAQRNDLTSCTSQ